MILTDAQIERYQRHIVLREVGGLGQKKLLAARVAVIGAGGLGSPLLYYLAAAGVGHIRIIDDDQISLSNLQRQILFTTADVGRLKADVAVERLNALNPDVEAEAISTRLTADNARRLLDSYDVIADGSDSFATRALVNAAAVASKTPLVSAAIGPFSGQLGVFAGYLPDVPCWACFTGVPVDIAGQSCADIGVLGAMAGMMGTAQAVEVIRLITGFGQPRLGRLWLFEALTLHARDTLVRKDPACRICGA